MGWCKTQVEKICTVIKLKVKLKHTSLEILLEFIQYVLGIMRSQKLTQRHIPQPEALESVAASQLIPHGTATTNQHTLTQQIHQRTRTTTTNRLRQDLLNLGEPVKNMSLSDCSQGSYLFVYCIYSFIYFLCFLFYLFFP